MDRFVAAADGTGEPTEYCRVHLQAPELLIVAMSV